MRAPVEAAAPADQLEPATAEEHVVVAGGDGPSARTVRAPTVTAVGAVALRGLDPSPVRVETTAGPGLPGTRVVGLPDATIREATARVRSAVASSRLEWPTGAVLVNLAPAGLRKYGGGFDLPIALSVVAGSRALDPGAVDGVWAHGELGLDGSVRDVPGVLPVAAAVARFGGLRLVVGRRSGVEAALVDGLEVIAVDDLRQAVAVLRGDAPVPTVPDAVSPAAPSAPDLVDVRGQPLARRALEIAAAGGHHILLSGPPGCGKSMLARRLTGLLPPLDLATALEVAAVRSVGEARAPDDPLSVVPPFVEPHHTATAAGLIGGGAGVPRPGAISLAHHGVLFLDELLEVPRWILDALRQPLERGEVVLTRAAGTVRYPARFQLVAATNPCPCGHHGDDQRACRCRPDQIQRYRARLSGPLLDRVDLQVGLRAVERDRLAGPPDGERSSVVAGRVAVARAAAADRWGRGTLVATIGEDALRRTASADALRRLARAVDGLGLSARAFDRCLRVARTIADLDGGGAVTGDHVDEAVAYRLPPATAGP